jgi:hypothetical protein
MIATMFSSLFFNLSHILGKKLYHGVDRMNTDNPATRIRIELFANAGAPVQLGFRNQINYRDLVPNPELQAFIASC